MKRIAIITGHSSRSPGATAYNGVSEYQYNAEVSHLMSHLHAYRISFNQKVNMSFRDRNGGWNLLRDNIRDSDVDATIELHFNAFRTATYGTECLYRKGNSEALDLSYFLGKTISAHYNTRLRLDDGAKALNPGDRGDLNLRYMADAGVGIPVLFEPCFGSHDTHESRAIIENPLEYASVLYEAIETYFAEG